MYLSRQKQHSLVTLLILCGIAVTFAFTVFPKPVLSLCTSGLFREQSGSIDTAARLFAGLNAILLALISSMGGRRLVPDRIPESTLTLPTSPGLSFGAQEPYRAIVIYSQLPSFSNQGAVLEHLRSAVVLANYKPILVGSFTEIDYQLVDRSVVGLLIDSQFHDYGLRRTQGTGKPLFTVQSSDTFLSSRVGNHVTLQIGAEVGQSFPEHVYAAALPLAQANTADVVRSVGFNGTWVTTYGVMSIRENGNGKVSGLYWYGRGEIKGNAEVDAAKAKVVMRFDWSQINNDSIGSRDAGHGVFVLEAGYEVFSGYWYVAGESFSTQLWCGTRLSYDIVKDMKRGGAFARDFGLSQHPLSQLVDPAA